MIFNQRKDNQYKPFYRRDNKTQVLTHLAQYCWQTYELAKSGLAIIACSMTLCAGIYIKYVEIPNLYQSIFE